jgi:hypothetical protein
MEERRYEMTQNDTDTVQKHGNMNYIKYINYHNVHGWTKEKMKENEFLKTKNEVIR